MSQIISYGCTSGAGQNVAEFWESLQNGRINTRPVNLRREIATFTDLPCEISTEAFQWNTETSASSAKELLLEQLRRSWSEALSQADSQTVNRIRSGERLGVILATTKSFVDDIAWTGGAQLDQDILAPLLDGFLKRAELSPSRKISVSNACASSLSALFLAKVWLDAKLVDDVVVIACDYVGPFVINGFNCLKVFAKEKVQPFSGERSGFYLGDASAAIILSNHKSALGLKLDGVGIDAEGYAVTRPSHSGDSLLRACASVPELVSNPPQVVVAHGTATQINDEVEDQVYQRLFAEAPSKPVVTATKWCVGHTLGASGALDVIAACEILKAQNIFAIATTPTIDPAFKASYLTANSAASNPRQISKVMLSSLGFGGIHAAASVSIDRPGVKQ